VTVLGCCETGVGSYCQKEAQAQRLGSPLENEISVRETQRTSLHAPVSQNQDIKCTLTINERIAQWLFSPRASSSKLDLG
jgi:hypothetical protein